MMKRWFAAAIAAGTLLTGGAFGAVPAAAADVMLYDFDHLLLSDEEYNDCVARLQQAADVIDMDISICFFNSDYYDGEYVVFPGYMYEEPINDGRDAVFCYLSYKHEEAEITFGTGGVAGMYYLEDERLDEIKQNLRDAMFSTEEADVAGAVNGFAADLEHWYNEGAIEGLCIYDDVNDVYYYEVDGEVITTEEPLEQQPQEEQVDEDISAPVEEEDEKEMPMAEYPGTALIYDEANCLDEDEYNDCLAMLQNAANQTGMNVGLVLGGERRSELTIESLAHASYDSMFGKNTDGLLYYMDLSGAPSPYDYISTSGLGQFYYTNSEKHDRINAMFDTIFPYLTAGSEDVMLATMAFAEEIIYYYELGIPKKYYVYDDVYDVYMYVEDGEIVSSSILPLSQVDTPEVLGKLVILGLFGIAIGFVVGLIMYLCVKSFYKFKVSLSPTAYVNRKKLVIHQQHDNFIRTYTTRVRIDSGGGGGGRGGGGGGGRSSGGHGGGGRHR